MIFAIIFVILKSLLWFYAIPLFQTPDEPSHFGYVQFIAENNRLLTPEDDKYSLEMVEGHKTLDIVRMLMHPQEKALYSEARIREIRQKTAELNDVKHRKDFSEPGMTANLYPPLYYGLASIFYKMFYKSDLVIRAYAVRVFSVILSFITIIFVYKTATLLFDDNDLVVIPLTLAVALQPMYSMVSIAINVDNLLYLFFAVLFYLNVKTIKAGEISGRDNLIMAIVVGMSLITKQYAIILLFMYMLNWLLVSKRRTIGHDFIKLLLFAIVSSSISLWWLLRNFGSQLTPFASKLSLKEYFWQQGGKYLWVLGSYWGSFGWLDTPVDFEKYLPVFLILFFVMVFGSALYLVREKDMVVKKMVFFMLAVFAFASLFIMYIDYRVADSLHNFIQGRYFLITLPVNTFLTAFGLWAFTGNKYREATSYALFAFFTFFNLASIFTYIIPRYYA